MTAQIYFWYIFILVLAFILGILVSRFLWLTKYDAIMQINTKDPEVDKYQLVLLCPFGELNKKDHLLVKVQKNI